MNVLFCCLCSWEKHKLFREHPSWHWLRSKVSMIFWIRKWSCYQHIKLWEFVKAKTVAIGNKTILIFLSFISQMTVWKNILRGHLVVGFLSLTCWLPRIPSTANLCFYGKLLCSHNLCMMTKEENPRREKSNKTQQTKRCRRNMQGTSTDVDVFHRKAMGAFSYGVDLS